MRIHVVTPKAPVNVTLNPRVQPAPNSCPIFVTGIQEPVRLSQSSYWILRLPYPFLQFYCSKSEQSYKIVSITIRKIVPCSVALNFMLSFGEERYFYEKLLEAICDFLK